MFDKLRAMMSLLGNASKIKEQVEGMQGRLAQVTTEGDAGAGMVRVTMNGRMDVLSITLSDEALKDKEMLEDLIRAALNQAVAKARQLAAEETQKMAVGLGLPAGMNLPGMS
jgi:DNA-binding YbaB/EbfC family protein